MTYEERYKIAIGCVIAARELIRTSADHMIELREYQTASTLREASISLADARRELESRASA